MDKQKSLQFPPLWVSCGHRFLAFLGGIRNALINQPQRFPSGELGANSWGRGAGTTLLGGLPSSSCPSSCLRPTRPLPGPRPPGFPVLHLLLDLKPLPPPLIPQSKAEPDKQFENVLSRKPGCVCLLALQLRKHTVSTL